MATNLQPITHTALQDQRARRWLWLIVGSYLVLATTYSLVTPLGEGPDEPGHAKYVFFLARTWRLPIQCAPPCENAVPGEGHQPPLAYLLAAPAVSWLPEAERDFDLPGNRNFVWVSGSEVNAVGHGSREYWPWNGMVLAWHLARIINVLVGSIAVILTYLAGRALLRFQVGLVASALMALNPQFLFTAGLITNDTLLTTLSALLLWLVVKPTLGVAPTRWHSLVVGSTLGLALITKQSALLLMPIAGIWCFSTNWHKRINRWEAWRGLFAHSSIVAGVSALISGWWYLRNMQIYGDLLGLAAFKAEFMTQPFAAERFDAWVSALLTLHESFWVRFGWMNVPAPRWGVWLYSAIELLALLGILRRFAAWHNWRSWLLRVWPLIVLPALTFAWVLSFAFTAGLVAWQGRLLFPALPALAILLATGLAAFFPYRSHHTTTPSANGRPFGSTASHTLIASSIIPADWLRFVTIIGFVSMAGLALWWPFGVIKPAYPFQTLTEAAAIARIGQPVYARYAARADERGAALRGIRVDGVAQAGQTVQVQLTWNALGRQNRDWWVFVHLVDDQEQILTEDNRPPRGGAFPMTQWVAGDWVESTHPLILPTDLAPGTYRLRIGLWFPETERRAGYFDAGSTLLGDYLELPFVVEP